MKDKFDWKAVITIVIVLYVFTYAGVWWGIGVLAIGVILLGWKNRNNGPLPINKQTNVLDEVKNEAKRLLEQAGAYDEELKKYEFGEKYDEIESKMRELGFLDKSNK